MSLMEIELATIQDVPALLDLQSDVASFTKPNRIVYEA